MSFNIDKIAHLSRIALTEDDRVALLPKLTDIVTMIDQLQTIDTTNIEPMINPVIERQPLRMDLITETNQLEKYQAIAPLTAAGLYIVPKVID